VGSVPHFAFLFVPSSFLPQRPKEAENAGKALLNPVVLQAKGESQSLFLEAELCKAQSCLKGCAKHNLA
jgi:hypothetical protein